jgi:hypothetical protein
MHYSHRQVAAAAQIRRSTHTHPQSDNRKRMVATRSFSLCSGILLVEENFLVGLAASFRWCLICIANREFSRILSLPLKELMSKITRVVASKYGEK